MQTSRDGELCFAAFFSSSDSFLGELCGGEYALTWWMMGFESDSEGRFAEEDSGFPMAKIASPSLALPSGTESSDSEAQSNLQIEIQELEKRLQRQFALRHALEKALGFRSCSVDVPVDCAMPKPTKELIREIAVLEVEVKHLEQYLLCLYRRVFEELPLSPSSSMIVQEMPELQADPSLRLRSSSDLAGHARKSSFSTHRSHSALSQRSLFSARASSLDRDRGGRGEVICLVEFLGKSMAEHLPETPNKISEDLVRCMGAIYGKLADAPQGRSAGGPPSSSPGSSFSSMGPFSPQYQGEPGSVDACLENPFRVEGLKEFSGPYNLMIEVPAVCLTADRLSDIEDLLVKYKSLASRLESVDPRKLNHEERVAFWLNIHNASMMQAHLIHGVARSSPKRLGLLFKAGCNVGGRIVTADAIQSTILRCRTHRPAQWLPAFLSGGLKTKKADDLQAYSIACTEPLLHFALCAGSLSDPAVRVYTVKRIQAELERARDEYLRAAVSIRKEQKILLPRLVEEFAKHAGLTTEGLLTLIRRYLPQTIQMAMRRCQRAGSHKVIEWVPHSFAFRYLLTRPLANLDLHKRHH
ncbi:uncharacterized protein LOC144702369 isoform X2 [Wolffia australiana]